MKKISGIRGRKASSIRYYSIIFILAALLLLTGSMPAHAAHKSKETNILILHSYHQGYEWTDNITRGIMHEFDRDRTDDTNIYVEYMDTKRYGLREMLPAMVRLYSQKYHSKRIDVVIACDDNALKLLLQSGESIFDGAPVIFCGVNSEELASQAIQKGYTGVMDNKDIRGTIDAALQLVPTLSQIAVISDETTTGQVLFRQYQAIADDYQGRVQFIELMDLNEETLAERLDQLPDNSAVLLLSLFSTIDDDSYNMQSAVDFIGRHTRAPVFILNDVYLGKGVAGGVVVSGQDQGIKAAGLAKLALGGAAPKDIPLIKRDITIPMFDYAVLTKKRISLQNIPPDSTLINKPFSLYEQYAVYIWVVIVIILAQGLTIALLITSNIKKKRAEKALRISEKKYRTIFETANEGIWVGDKEQNTLMVNGVLAKIFGYTPEEMVGRPIIDLISPDELADHELQVSKRAQGIDAIYERRFVRKDGTPIWCLVSAKSMTDADGNFEGSFTMVSDISDRKLMEERLLTAKDKAEEANLAKDEFLANMSHEVRTPLNGILGMLHLLQGTSQNDEQKEYTTNAITAGRRLTHLLSDLLDISRIEARKMEIRHEVFKIRNTMSAVMELLHTAANEKKLDVSLYIDEDIPYELLGDSTRLQQIFINLIGNAIKFTDRGFVKVEVVRLSSNQEGRERLLFTVSDSGIGIPDDKQDSVFDSFIQADAAYSRKHQGAGLGLQIVKRLASLMKGNISLSSEVGVGTSISVSIPFDVPEQQAERTESVEPEYGDPIYQKALVVEDDRLNRLSLSRHLEKLGLEVMVAEDGQEALEVVENNSFDIIFMDIQMPNMDGLETTKHIRADSRYLKNSSIPIVAITAYAMPSDKQKFLNAGMDHYISKPFEVADLKKILAGHNGQG